MISFREWLNEREGNESYKDFFNKKLEKFGIKSVTELSVEDKKKFFNEIANEWEGEKEEPEVDEKKACNEAMNKSQIEFSKLHSDLTGAIHALNKFIRDNSDKEIFKKSNKFADDFIKLFSSQVFDDVYNNLK